MNAIHLKSHHKQALEAIFRHPIAHNLDWNDIAGLLGHLGSIAEQHNGGFVVSIGAHKMTIARPRGKNLATPEIRHLRQFLVSAGIEAPDTHSDTAAGQDIPEGLQLVVVIDHQAARIFRTGGNAGESETPRVLTPHDPHGFLRHLVHRKEANYAGERVPEDPAFYEAIAEALVSAQEIRIVSHGTGKSNAGVHLLEHLQKRHPDIAARVVASFKADLSHATEAEILALARPHMEMPLPT